MSTPRFHFSLLTTAVLLQALLIITAFSPTATTVDAQASSYCVGTVSWCEPHTGDKPTVPLSERAFPYPLREENIEYGNFAEGTTIYFEHTSGTIFWSASAVNKIVPRIFPGTCQSDVSIEQNPYGFNHFKDYFFKKAFISKKDRRIRMLGIELNRSAVGYTATVDETITCGPFKDENGESLYIGTLPTADATVSFRINANPTQSAMSITVDDKINSVAQWFESHVRVFGIELNIMVRNDAWIGAEVIPYIAKSFKCWPRCFQGLLKLEHFSWKDTNPGQIEIRVPPSETRNYNLPTNDPETNELFIENGLKNLTLRQRQLDQFDGRIVKIYPHSQVPTAALNSPKDRGTKNPPSSFSDTTNWVGLDNQGPGNNLTISEDCIRGRWNDDPKCGMMLAFVLLNQDQITHPLVNTYFSTNSIMDYFDGYRKNAVRSTRNPKLPFDNWFSKLERFPGASGFTTMGMWWNSFPEYEIDRRDTLRFKVTYDVLRRQCIYTPPADKVIETGSTYWNRKEAVACFETERRSEPPQEYVTESTYALNIGTACGPGALSWAQEQGLAESPAQTYGSCPILVTVEPSRGHIIGQLPPAGFAAKSIWEGGTVAYITLDGEKFPDTAETDFVNQITSDDPAWISTHRDCIFPSGSIKFPISPITGELNKTTLEITFSPCDDYLITKQETIRFFADNKASVESFTTVSGLPLVYEDSTGFTMTVDTSPGFIDFLGPTEFEEASVIDGTMAFQFYLRGDTFASGNVNFATRCLARIQDPDPTGDPLGSWVVTTTATSDPAGFTNLTMRNILAGAGSWQINNTASLNRVLSFTVAGGSSSPHYNTLKGENIAIDFTKLPGECFNSGKAPNGNINIRIKPQNAYITPYYLQGGVESSAVDAPFSENRFRRGTFSIVFVAEKDTFEDIDPTDSLADRVYANVSSLVSEAAGFNKYKDKLIQPSQISLNSPENTRLTVTFTGFLKYDIAGNETLQIFFDAGMMAASRLPMNPNHYFEVYAAAGQVVLESWSGYQEDGINWVNEEDFRLGTVWFNFSILGDQWRQQRGPFVESLSSNDPLPTSLGSLKEELVPDMSFFTFTSSDLGFDFMRLSLQAAERFNINGDEVVTLSLSNRTINSGIPPVFFIDGNETTEWVFRIKVRPGKLVMSGTVYRLTEKMMRRGRIVVFLTLIGELWATTNTTTKALRDAMSVVAVPGVPQPTNGFGNPRLKDIILPVENLVTSPGKEQLTITFTPSETYNIDEVETIQINIDGEMFQSGLVPELAVEKLQLKIEPAGGELSVTSETATRTEEQMRKGTFFSLKLAGDRWNASILSEPDNKREFIDSFGSLSPVSSEPTGFLAQEQFAITTGSPRMLELGLPQGEAVTVTVQPTPGYDIENSEVITFAISNPDFVETKTRPDPFLVKITITPSIRKLVLLADEKSDILGGAVNLPNFEKSIAELLKCDADRVVAEYNTTKYREEDQLAIILVHFQGHGTGSDSQTNAELSDILVALQSGFMYQKLGVKWAYFDDNPPAYEDIHDPPPPPPPPPVVEEEPIWVFLVWIVGGIALILIMVGGYFAVMRFFFASRLPGTVRTKSNRAGKDRYETLEIPDETKLPKDVKIPKQVYQRVTEKGQASRIHRSLGEFVAERNEKEVAMEQDAQNRKMGLRGLAEGGVSSAQASAQNKRQQKLMKNVDSTTGRSIGTKALSPSASPERGGGGGGALNTSGGDGGEAPGMNKNTLNAMLSLS